MKLEINVKVNLNNWLKREHLEHLEKIDFGKLDSQIAIEKKDGEDHKLNLIRNDYNSGNKFHLSKITIEYTRLDNIFINNFINTQSLTDKINTWDLKYLCIDVEDIIDDLEIVDYSTEEDCEECYQYTVTLEKLFHLYCNNLKKYLDNKIDEHKIKTQKDKEVLDKVIEYKDNDENIIEIQKNYVNSKEKVNKYINYKNELEEIERLKNG